MEGLILKVWCRRGAVARVGSRGGVEGIVLKVCCRRGGVRGA